MIIEMFDGSRERREEESTPMISQFGLGGFTLDSFLCFSKVRSVVRRFA